MKYPLIVKGKPKTLVISHNRQTKFTKAQLGKFIATERGALDKIGPLNLICPDENIKILAVYAKKSKSYKVSVNGEAYMSLPYEAPNFDEPEDDEVFSANILINGQVVWKGKRQWN